MLTAVVLASALAVPAAAGDLTIVSKTSATGPMVRSGVSTTYMSADKVRVAGEQADILVDIATGTITFLDNAKKQYWQMTRADMDALSQKMSDSMAQMQKDPKAAAAMETMFGAMGTAKLEEGPEKKTIAGYSCSEYILTMGTGIKMTYWTTTALAPPFTPEQMYNAMGSLLRANPMLGRVGPLFDEMKKMKGVPLASTTDMTMGPMHVQTTQEATEVKTGAVPASTFEIPAGYTKVDSPMSKMVKR
jgi:hypothetical protein